MNPRHRRTFLSRAAGLAVTLDPRKAGMVTAIVDIGVDIGVGVGGVGVGDTIE
jgi:hypothetical protein